MKTGRRLAQHRVRQVRQVPVGVVAYDPSWPVTFEALRGRVDAALAAVDHVTEHVGSTAVPGLDAKPIVDMDVVVPDPVAVAAAIAGLAAAGWQPGGDQGVPGRAALAPPQDAPYHHLYVVVAGSQPHRDDTDLREYLRARPNAAARYAAVKGRLAYLLETDREAYTSGKAELIGQLLRRARAGLPDPAR
jgi:GrpB-like predicted nucleotidyltransferase (UPF0157 family)